MRPASLTNTHFLHSPAWRPVITVFENDQNSLNLYFFKDYLTNYSAVQNCMKLNSLEDVSYDFLVTSNEHFLLRQG